MILHLSKLKCVRHVFVFNDGSEVAWYPTDPNGKGHQLFAVAFRIKTSYGSLSFSDQIVGPASAAASLHYLKLILKDNVPE
jgi:hypothetical protein